MELLIKKNIVILVKMTCEIVLITGTISIYNYFIFAS